MKTYDYETIMKMINDAMELHLASSFHTQFPKNESEPLAPPAHPYPDQHRAWLVERIILGSAHWYGRDGWTTDANKAVQFINKRDTENFIKQYEMFSGITSEAIASEHMWLNDNNLLPCETCDIRGTDTPDQWCMRHKTEPNECNGYDTLNNERTNPNDPCDGCNSAPVDCQGLTLVQACAQVKYYKELADRFEKKNSTLRSALIKYADEDEWIQGMEMSQWKLQFNSSYQDGDGWSIAKEALELAAKL